MHVLLVELLINKAVTSSDHNHSKMAEHIFSIIIELLISEALTYLENNRRHFKEMLGGREGYVSLIHCGAGDRYQACYYTETNYLAC